MLIVFAERYGHGVVVPPLLLAYPWELLCKKLGRDQGQRNPFIMAGLLVFCVSLKRRQRACELFVSIFLTVVAEGVVVKWWSWTFLASVCL